MKNGKLDFMLKDLLRILVSCGALFLFAPHPMRVAQGQEDLEQELKLAGKKMNRQFTFSVQKRRGGRKLNAFQDVVASGCVLGLWFRLKNDRGQVMEEGQRKEGIDLLSVEDIIEMDPAVKETSFLGYSLKFQPGEKVLSFPSLAQRKKYLGKIKHLKALCLEKREREIQQNSSCQQENVQKGDDLILPSGFSFGIREIHKRLQGENQDMEVALLKEKESFAERYASALKAKKSIFVQSFIFTGDESGFKLGELLIKKKKEGLDVQALIDYFSALIYIIHPIDRENTYILFNNMMAAGIPVHGYACMGGIRHLVKEFHNSIKMGTPGNHRLSIHEKVWLTDQEQAVMGGININNYYFGVNPPGNMRWRDQDLVVKGKKIITDLNNIFEGNVRTYKENRISAENKSCFNPHPVGTPEYEKFLKKHTKSYIHAKLKDKSHHGKYAEKILRKLAEGEINGKIHAPRFHPIEEARVIQSRPDIGETYIEDAYIDMINKAKKEIWLVNSYFIPTPAFIQALQNAAKRGVKVRILSNSSTTNDFPPSVLAGRRYYHEIVGASLGTPHEIEIYEWNGINKKTGKKVRGMLHSKFGTFDDNVTILGSYNFDSASRDGNGEIVLVYKGQEITKELKRLILKEDLKYASKVDYASMIKFRKPRGAKRLGKKWIYNWSHKNEDKF